MHQTPRIIGLIRWSIAWGLGGAISGVMAGTLIAAGLWVFGVHDVVHILGAGCLGGFFGGLWLGGLFGWFQVTTPTRVRQYRACVSMTLGGAIGGMTLLPLVGSDQRMVGLSFGVIGAGVGALVGSFSSWAVEPNGHVRSSYRGIAPVLVYSSLAGIAGLLGRATQMIMGTYSNSFFILLLGLCTGIVGGFVSIIFTHTAWDM